MLVIGAGFTGSEIASACRERGIEVTVAERGTAPLVGALGGTLAKLAAGLQRAHGVDLRCGVTVTALCGNGSGRFTGADLSDGSHIDADVCVIAMGAVRNVEWLADSGLAAGPHGVACDAGCRCRGGPCPPEKMLKRQMFGRAGFELLRKRVLLA